MRATTTTTSATREDALRVGDEGVDVARLQQRLLDDGFERVGAVDGCVDATNASHRSRGRTGGKFKFKSPRDDFGWFWTERLNE